MNFIADRISHNIKDLPSKIAVKTDVESISYAQLDILANKILCAFAHSYVSFMSSNEPIKIGVCLKRSKWLIPSIWAIIKSSNTYVPLDFETPDDRLRYIVKDSGVKVILCEAGDEARFDGVCAVVVEDCENTETDDEVLSKASNAPVFNNAAYIIYTSGTTGKPKGIPLKYSSLYSLVETVTKKKYLDIDQSSKILCFASINFDASVLDIFSSLFSGATLVVANEMQRKDVKQIHSLLKENDITFVLLPPSIYTLLPDYDFPAMRTLALGGEPLLPCIVENASKYPYRHINAYGPTENTVISTMADINSDIDFNNIGKPIEGVYAYVLDDNLQPVKNGEVGELCLGGAQLTNGYIKLPKLNRKSFFNNSYKTQEEAPVLYHSGDLVRLNEDGSFTFIKRKDRQIKFNGYRIELEEIERSIENDTNVIQACVNVEMQGSYKILVAYIKMSDGVDGNLDVVKNELRKKLPHYMMPTLWVCVDEFPRNINGKIDKKQLASSRTVNIEQHTLNDKAVTRKEKIMLQVVSSVTNISDIDVDDDLFDNVGLTSIQVMQIPELLDAFGITLTVEDFYNYRTIRKILRNHKSHLSYWYNEPSKDKPVMVIVSGYTSFHFLFDKLAGLLSEYYSIYVIESYHEYPSELVTNCEVLTDYYMKSIESFIADYDIKIIVGFCLGGELGLYLSQKLYQKYAILPDAVVIDGEVGRDVVRENLVPLKYDSLSEEINQKRDDRDYALISSIPDFRYPGKVASILVDTMVGDFSPFYTRTPLTDIQIECATDYFERAPRLWKQYYPDCDLLFVEGDHYTILKTKESIIPIVNYLHSKIDGFDYNSPNCEYHFVQRNWK